MKKLSVLTLEVLPDFQKKLLNFIVNCEGIDKMCHFGVSEGNFEKPYSIVIVAISK